MVDRKLGAHGSLSASQNDYIPVVRIDRFREPNKARTLASSLTAPRLGLLAHRQVTPFFIAAHARRYWAIAILDSYFCHNMHAPVSAPAGVLAAPLVRGHARRMREPFRNGLKAAG